MNWRYSCCPGTPSWGPFQFKSQSYLLEGFWSTQRAFQSWNQFDCLRVRPSLQVSHPQLIWISKSWGLWSTIGLQCCLGQLFAWFLRILKCLRSFEFGKDLFVLSWGSETLEALTLIEGREDLGISSDWFGPQLSLSFQLNLRTQKGQGFHHRRRTLALDTKFHGNSTWPSCLRKSPLFHLSTQSL